MIAPYLSLMFIIFLFVAIQETLTELDRIRIGINRKFFLTNIQIRWTNGNPAFAMREFTAAIFTMEAGVG